MFGSKDEKVEAETGRLADGLSSSISDINGKCFAISHSFTNLSEQSRSKNQRSQMRQRLLLNWWW